MPTLKRLNIKRLKIFLEDTFGSRYKRLKIIAQKWSFRIPIDYMLSHFVMSVLCSCITINVEHFSEDERFILHYY